MMTKDPASRADEQGMKNRIDVLMADLNRMAAELELRNQQTRERIARTDELLARWSREQATSDMGISLDTVRF